MTFCVSGGRGDLHGVRGDELAPYGGRTKHSLKAVEKILANYDHWLATAGPAFGRGNCFNDWGHSTRINAWKMYYVNNCWKSSSNHAGLIVLFLKSIIFNQKWYEMLTRSEQTKHYKKIFFAELEFKIYPRNTKNQ